MKVSFVWAGLALVADVDYKPAVPASTYAPPEMCDPGEDDELDVNDLQLAANGADVMLLLTDSLYGDEIDAALRAAILAMPPGCDPD